MPKDKGGLGLLVMSDDEKPSAKGAEGDDEDYSPEAKADLAKQFYEASSSADFDKAGQALEKFVHLCVGE